MARHEKRLKRCVCWKLRKVRFNASMTTSSHAVSILFLCLQIQHELKGHQLVDVRRLGTKSSSKKGGRSKSGSSKSGRKGGSKSRHSYRVSTDFASNMFLINLDELMLKNCFDYSMTSRRNHRMKISQTLSDQNPRSADQPLTRMALL